MTTVYSPTSAVLPSGADDLVLTGTADINGTGNTRDNTITGNAGANVLDGRAGADTLIGGAGNDTYVVDNAGDRVVEHAGEGVDTVNASVNHTLADNVENLNLAGGSIGTGNALDNTMTGNSGHNTLNGLDGNDTLSGGAGNDTLDGGAGDDIMAGGTGNDTFVVDAAGDSVIEAAGAGDDTVRSHLDYVLGDNLENLVLAGNADLEGRGNLLDNSLAGNSGANALYGEAGDDTLDGGLGADHMEGGAGNDTYVVDDEGDRVIEGDGAGLDTVQSSISTTLSEHVENLALSGAAAIDGTGNTLDNLIVGNAGANLLAGLEGNDILDGGAGADTLQGGSGNDTYYVDNALDTVVELDGEGEDKVVASVHHTLAANVEHLTLAGTGGISGTGNELDNEISGNSVNNALHGLDGDDTLYGNGGHDVLDGGSGADLMHGGVGDDTYVVDQAGDRVVESANAGADLVRSSVDYALTDNVEHLALTGSADLAGTGNALANTIEGNSGNNLIAGGAGNDTVRAGDGRDQVDGGDGNDTLNGEGGNDVLFGGAGSDSISGGAGDDHMEGGLGDDTYSVEDAGDLVVEDAGAGADMVNAGRSYTLTANVENLTLVGMSDIDGTGNELNNTIYGSGGANLLQGLDGDDTIHANNGNDTLVGGEGNDILNGDTGNDRLQGDAGNDALNGGAGVDDMAGGTGNDSYTVDNAGDLVHEHAGEGVDTVSASVDYTLTSNVEHLSLFGFGNIAGRGNELDNTVGGNNAHNQLFGLEGNDTLLGLAGNDTLDGGLGADVMQGGVGDDTYLVDNAGDRVEELANQGNADTVRSEIDYTLTANVENLVLLGNEDLIGAGNNLNNVITGNSGNNSVSAGDGADTVHAGAGSDLVSGGNGNDTLNGEAGEDQLYGDAGNDRLDGGEGADRMSGGLGDDVFIVGDAGDQAIEAAGEGTDIVHASVTTTLLDNVENLLLTGGADIDGNGNELNNVITGNSGANVLDGRAGDDTISGGLGNDRLVGGEGNDVLNGDAGDDHLQGDAGNDTLGGGAGRDTMQGGSGDDTYVVDNAGDLAIEHADEGTDTVQSTVSFTLGDNVENLTLAGSGAINGTGNGLDNVITGNSGGNLLDGGAGADTMAGGAGNDTYVVDDAGDVVTEGAGGGTDTVESSLDYTLGANVEKLVLTGSAHLAGAGNTLANTITGNGGDNRIDGGAGADTMSGGMGDDTYVVDAAGDTVVEAANAGRDTVHAGVSYTLAANVENLVLTGTAALAGGGNALDNTITGNAGNNVLNGMAGDDLIDAGAGNDTLDGGSGADTMLGGAGDDTYLVDDAGDIVIEQSGEGADTVVSSIDYTLGLHLNNLTLVGGALNGTGNTAVNIITGNSADNVLDGAGGKDTLVGGAGNDTYIVDGGDTIVELAGGGIDTVRAEASYTLGAHLDNLVLLGSGDLSGTGNALANSITGNAGANVLDGGAGADILAGGAGDDTYLADATGDLVLEADGEGVDTVQASANYTLGAHVEHLVLTGSGNLAGTGNAGDNTITGNSGANVLDGGAGNDTLDGGAGADTLLGGSGDDTYVVDDAGDVVVEGAGNGVDTVLAGASHVLAANVEHLVLTGEANLQGTGNASANTLTGNGGDNLLSGMDGDDLLAGGAGNDVLMGGAGDDTYVFGIGDGMERIIDAQGSGTLRMRGGLTAADLLAEQSGRDLVLTIAASGDSVTLVDWLGQAEGVTRIVFEDGSAIDHGGMAALLNAAPLAADDSIVVQEDGGAVLLPVTRLLANDLDPDLGDVMSVIAVGASGIGAGVGLADGAVAYDIGGRFQELAQGEVLDDSFTYTITDEMGETSTAVVHVQVIGTNDAAVTVADSAEAVEDGTTVVSGNVLANDSDIDRGTVLQVAAPGAIAGVYGSLLIAADGSYTYRLNDGAASVQGLNAGEVVTDTFAYVATDGIEGVASTLGITITGSNDAPVLSADTAQILEDSAVAAGGNVLANDSDADSGTVLLVSEPGVYSGAYGTLALARDGSYTYTLDSNAAAVQALAEGQSAVDSFSYAATDGMSVVASTLDITVTGTNDAPLLAADHAQLSEDAAGVSGNVLANDSDADFGAMLAAGAATSQGRYGSLALDADGSYQYRLDTAAVQSLGRGASVVDRFSYGAGDGLASGQSTLDITVTGANDAPIVVTPLADRSLTFNKAFSFKLPPDSFKDLDQGDTLSYSASLADGSELPAWLKFDAKTGTFSGATPKQVGAIEVRVTATDQVGATGSTEGSLSASDVFTLSVSHGNEGVGNGEDAAPGGHDGNQNDGPGTGPGNPGSKGGKRFGLAIGVSASNGVASVSVAATAQTTDALGVPALLSASKIVEFSLPASGIGNTTSAQSFGAWLKVDLAVSEALAEKKSLAWLDERIGADTGALARATLGFLGSTVAFGGGGLTLSGSAGVELKGFEGLGKGTRKLK